MTNKHILYIEYKESINRHYGELEEYRVEGIRRNNMVWILWVELESKDGPFDEFWDADYKAMCVNRVAGVYNTQEEVIKAGGKLDMTKVLVYWICPYDVSKFNLPELEMGNG